jgi:tetratricopeptide (TPR) repeat protein
MQQFYLDRYDAGATLLAQSSDPQGAAGAVPLIFYGRLLTGRLDDADAECGLQLRKEDPRVFGPYRWACTILWRNQGRYRDAYNLIAAGRLPGGYPLAARLETDQVSLGVLELEMGRPLLALGIWDAIRPDTTSVAPGRFARELTWYLVRRGTAAVAAGQFDLARQLADSAELIGQRSLYGRDPKLHYFLRGLLAATSGDHESAIDLFRRSVNSWTYGYTRANLELARSLMVVGRPHEAIVPLRAALHGGWDGSNLYVTRTELHEALAQAFAAAGARDSATAHYRAVERAWRHADPNLAPRYQAARAWLESHGAIASPGLR